MAQAVMCSIARPNEVMNAGNSFAASAVAVECNKVFVVKNYSLDGFQFSGQQELVP
jgi:hypothetical protein